MTIQLALANSNGIAMASDRHVYRGAEPRSTGRDVKLLRLRTEVPAALMASGPLAVFDVPVARIALPLESAIAAAQRHGNPEALAEAVLDVLDRPLPGALSAGGEDADAQVLDVTAEQVLERACDSEQTPARGLEQVLAEIERASACRNEARIRDAARALWEAHAARLPASLIKPRHVAAVRDAPELCGRAVVGALTRDWRKLADLYLTVGMCCPATGVPIVVSLRLWRGIGRRLHFVSRFACDYETLWRSSRTVAVAQGSGRPLIEAMIDGIADEHWRRMPRAERDMVGREMGARWDRTHDRVAVSGLGELGALAGGLVRGAEAIGFLTREGEGTIAPIDCVVLTPYGISDYALGGAAPASACRASPMTLSSFEQSTAGILADAAAG
jgi:hypothetical protein